METFRAASLGRAVAIAAVLALPGCATVARARAVQDPASAIPGERTPTAAELGLPLKGPVSLRALVAAALRVHPSAIAALRAAEAAHARILEAEAARRGQVSIDSSASLKDQSGSSGGGASHRFASLGFDVSWLVFDFGRTAALTRQAGEQWLAAQAEERSALIDVALGVRSAFFTLIEQRELLATDQEAVRQFQEHLDQVKEQVRIGMKGRIPYDVTKAEVDLGNARLAVVVTQDAVLSAEATLASSVGLAEIVDWVPAAGATAMPVPTDFDSAWATARTREPALAAAAARELAACALVDADVAALYPGLSLGLAYQKSGSSIPLPWSASIGPRLQWTPFDGYQNLATIDEAVAGLREARAKVALAEQAAWLAVRTAWIAVEDARRRLDLTALTVRSAEENLTLAQGRFDAGLAISIDLTDARTALVQAKTARITAEADLAIAAAKLAKALGISSREP